MRAPVASYEAVSYCCRTGLVYRPLLQRKKEQMLSQRHGGGHALCKKISIINYREDVAQTQRTNELQLRLFSCLHFNTV